MTDLESEFIIGDLLRNITVSVTSQFGYLNTSRMTSLTENNLPYHIFHHSLSEENNQLYLKFKQWLSEENTREKLRTNCKWFAELVMYELNHVYQIWYNEKPQFWNLSVGLRKYLEDNHSEYYSRMVKLETGSHLK